MKTPIRSTRCELEGGYFVVLRINPPMRIFEEVGSKDYTRIMKALAKLTLESNLTDDDDQPIDLQTVEGWGEVNLDVVLEVMRRWNEALGLPKATSSGSATPSSPEAAASTRPTV